MAADETATLEVEVDGQKAAVQIRRTRKDFNRFARDAERSMLQVRKSMETVASSARLLTASLVASLGAVSLGEVVDQFAQFEKRLIAVGKTTNISGTELETLGARIQEIAARVPVATTELLEIAQAAGQLGISGSDNILKFTETIGKLGLASNLAGEEAATTLARILEVTGTDVSHVDKLASTIVQLGNNFAATEAEIASATKRIAQATSVFNVSAQDAAGMGAALQALGVEAELGGSAVGRTFAQMNAAISSGSASLKVFAKVSGQSVGAFKQAFRDDSAGAFEAFITGLGKIQRSGGDVAGVLSAVNLKGVENLQVIGTLAGRYETLSRALSMAKSEWENNIALNKEAAVAATSFSAQMQIFGNVLDAALVELGSMVAPALIDFADGIKTAIAEAREAGVIAALGQTLHDAFVGLVAVAETVVNNFELLTIAGTAFVGLRIGGMVAAWVSAFAQFAKAIRTAAGAQAVLNAILLANPIGVVVAAIGALTAAITLNWNEYVTLGGEVVKVRDVVKGTWFFIKDVVTASVASISEAFAEIFLGNDQIDDSFSGLADSIESYMRFIHTFVVAGVNAMLNSLLGLKETAIAVVNEIKGLFSNEAVNSGFDGLLSRIEKIHKRDLLGEISDKFTKSVKKAAEDRNELEKLRARGSRPSAPAVKSSPSVPPAAPLDIDNLIAKTKLLSSKTSVPSVPSGPRSTSALSEAEKERNRLLQDAKGLLSSVATAEERINEQLAKANNLRQQGYLTEQQFATIQQRLQEQLPANIAARRAAEEALAEQQTQRQALEQQADQLIKQTVTEKEKILASEQQIVALQQQGLLNEQQALTLRQQNADKLREISTDWVDGAARAFEDYTTKATNNAAQLESVLGNTFKGAENALANFITTGEFKFGNFVQSIASQMAKIASSQLLSAAFSMFGMPGAGGLFAGLFADGGAFDGGVQKFANGGVVESPTVFPMKNGAGLMGEAGPEAVMPLKRLSNGALGVQASGTGGGGPSVVTNVTVNVQSGAPGERENASQMGKVISRAVEAQVTQVLGKHMRPGGALNKGLQTV